MLAVPRSSALLLLAALLVPTLAAAGPPADALALLERWLDAQNRGDFAAYQQLYATSFEGIRRSGARVTKLDRAGWLKDRERMFQKKMTVTAADRNVEAYGSGHRVTFTQTWSSGSYKDTGTKELILLEEGGELRIFREELLESVKDLGIKGQALLVWDAGKPEATAEALDAAERVASLLATVVDFPSGFPTRLEGGVDGVAADEAVVALGVCTPREAAVVIDLFRRLGPRVSLRETTWRPRAKESSCPSFYKDSDSAGRGWSWPGTSASAGVAGGNLTVVALRREDAELGDFAREYQENLFVAVLAGKDGVVRKAAAFKGGSDFAQLEGIERLGASVIANERYVDAPCDGTDRHRYAVITHSLRFALKDGDIEKKVMTREVVERGRCGDDEMKFYR
jgi:hypothetical protein